MVLYALQSGMNASSVHICGVHLVDVALGLDTQFEVHMDHDSRGVARVAGLPHQKRAGNDLGVRDGEPVTAFHLELPCIDNTLQNRQRH